MGGRKRTHTVKAPECDYGRMWAELRRWLDADRSALPDLRSPAHRAASRSRRFHAEHMLALMDQLEESEQ